MRRRGRGVGSCPCPWGSSVFRRTSEFRISPKATFCGFHGFSFPPEASPEGGFCPAGLRRSTAAPPPGSFCVPLKQHHRKQALRLVAVLASVRHGPSWEWPSDSQSETRVSPGLRVSRVFSNTTVQKHQFSGAQLYGPTLTSPYMTTCQFSCLW